MLDHVAIEQVNAWIARLRGGDRPFDYIHGFLAGLACAERVAGELGEVFLVIPLLPDDDPGSTKDWRARLPPGLFAQEIIDTLSGMFDDIEEELDSGTFHPYMGGRFVRRIKPDTPLGPWCMGFLRTTMIYADRFPDDEELKMMIIPVLLSAKGEGPAEEAFDPVGPGNTLTDEEKADLRAKVRDRLIASVIELYGYLGSDTEGKEHK